MTRRDMVRLTGRSIRPTPIVYLPIYCVQANRMVRNVNELMTNEPYLLSFKGVAFRQAVHQNMQLLQN